MKRAALFSSASTHYATPADLRAALEAEFAFTLDPCPLGWPQLGALDGTDGLARSWARERVFCNPPYGPGIPRWLAKAEEAVLAVYLLPARADTAWFHDSVLPEAEEIRFLRGRLSFPGGTGKRPRAPFPSMIVVYRTHPIGGPLCRW